MANLCQAVLATAQGCLAAAGSVMCAEARTAGLSPPEPDGLMPGA
jgi:hypothetical protein